MSASRWRIDCHNLCVRPARAATTHPFALRRQPNHRLWRIRTMNRRTLLAAAAFAPFAAIGPAVGQSGLAGPGAAHRRAVRAGLLHGRLGAASRQRAHRAARPVGRGREPRRRGRHRRHDRGGSRAAGRLYAAAHRHLALDLSRPLPEPAVRPGARSGADQPDRGLAFDPAGAARAGAAHARGAGGAGEAAAGRHHLRLRRAGVVRASRDGAFAEPCRRAGAARAVPRRGGGDRGGHRRPRRHGDREPGVRAWRM